MHHSPWLCRVWATAGAGKVTVSIQAEAKSHYTLRPGQPEGQALPPAWREQGACRQ